MFYDEEKTFQDFDDFIEKSEEFISSSTTKNEL